jgi:nucleoside-diphosphate-sugar epimerase
MNVLVVGATGYVGSAVERAFAARFHRTAATVRSDVARMKLAAHGIQTVYGDASRPETLLEPVRAADAVVYCVGVTDADPWTVDLAAIRKIGHAMAGTERTFIYMSDAWMYGDTDEPADETVPVKPPVLRERRAQIERIVLNMVKIGIRSHVIRAGVVYGDGGGIATMFVHSARDRHAATIVGNGSNHWATIARSDLAPLVALVAERGKPGAIYNAVDDHSFTIREIAEAASRGAGAGGAVTAIHPEFLGPFGECLMLDQTISNERAKRDLLWRPSAPSIVEDLERGSYLSAQLAS